MGRALAIRKERAKRNLASLGTVQIFKAPEDNGFLMLFGKAGNEKEQFLDWLGNGSGAGNLAAKRGDKVPLTKEEADKIIGFARGLKVDIQVRESSELQMPSYETFHHSGRGKRSNSSGARNGAAPFFSAGRKKRGEGPSHIWF